MSSRAKVELRPLLGDAARDLLLASLAATDHGVMLTDLDHTTLACNARFGEIWGIDAGNVVISDPRQVREMVAARIPNIQDWAKNLEQVYADPTHTQEDKLHLIHPRQVIRRYTAPVTNPNGEVVGRIWTFLDISQEERRRLRSQLLQDASLICDPDPEKVYARLVEEVAVFYDSVALLSIAKEDYMEFRAVGAPPSHPVRSMAGNRLPDSYCQYCLTQGSMIIQNALDRPETAEMLPARLGFTRYAGVPIISPNGETVGTFCILDGHSDEALDQEDLNLLSLIAMRISSELDRERRMQDLESDLETAQAHAIQNEKLAAAGTLSAAIAHDIRNILTAMKLDLTAGPNAMIRHIDRFSLLAHRLLSYAQPHHMVREPVEVVESLRRVLSLLSAHASIARIDVHAEMPETLPPILADPSRLDHLFVNLILNAIQAMNRGGQLTLAASEGDGQVQVIIRDTGPGMTQEQINGLFQPFASSRPDGFGLGLYSARQIARECGGQIDVESQPGQGATFTVRIPTL